MQHMKRILFILSLSFLINFHSSAQTPAHPVGDFPVKGFHIDLRIQVMTMDALKAFAVKLHGLGINTLIMEWEATYPYETHPVIPNRYAYTKEEIGSFISYCSALGIDVIPLQQCFGHVEYILRHYRYRDLREDEKDYSQVCPMKAKLDSTLFADLFKELISTHSSPYVHIGGDETYLLGHCPLCRKQAEKVGRSRLYIDYIKMLCDMVIKMGKKPLVWADIAIKYPEAIRLLPRGTIFIDWNYGWDLNRFGNHQKLMESGFEIWGAASIRSHPDNYFLTDWGKHFRNIRDFIPLARSLGYRGMIMTSWSTSGQYSTVQESESDIFDLYAIRHVYPLKAFNLLLSAYAEALAAKDPLNIEKFFAAYCKTQYGFDAAQSSSFQKALTAVPHEVEQGTVQSPQPMSVDGLLDSINQVCKTLSALEPSMNKEEFEQYRLMAAIRRQYVVYESLEAKANAVNFSKSDVPAVVAKLQSLINESESLNKKFIELNRDYYYPAVLEEENELRNKKLHILYAKLSNKKD
jgi:hexosaminidase